MKNYAKLSLSMKEDERDMIRDAAAEEGRSMVNYILRLVERDRKEKAREEGYRG